MPGTPRAGDICDAAEPAKRSMGSEGGAGATFKGPRSYIAFGFCMTGSDGVDADLPRRQFERQASGQRFDGSFFGRVEQGSRHRGAQAKYFLSRPWRWTAWLDPPTETQSCARSAPPRPRYSSFPQQSTIVLTTIAHSFDFHLTPFAATSGTVMTRATFSNSTVEECYGENTKSDESRN